MTPPHTRTASRPPATLLALQEEFNQLDYLTTKLIRARDIVVAHWVRLKCQYGCVEYGRRLSCPPYSPTSEEIQKVLQEYSWGILVRFDPTKISAQSVQLPEKMRELEKQTFLRGYYKALALTSGPCRLCEECDVSRCRSPAMVRPSMEATGIDVFSTVKRAGFKITTLQTKDQHPSFFGLLLVE